MSGGGGGTSSNEGGANDGVRRRCIGRGGRSFVFALAARPSASVARCAAGGRARPPEPLVKLLVTTAGKSSRSEPGGVRVPRRRRAGAPAHPHSNSGAGVAGSEPGVVYAGR